jgi:hypothetical protein
VTLNLIFKDFQRFLITREKHVSDGDDSSGRLIVMVMVANGGNFGDDSNGGGNDGSGS